MPHIPYLFQLEYIKQKAKLARHSPKRRRPSQERRGYVPPTRSSRQQRMSHRMNPYARPQYQQQQPSHRNFQQQQHSHRSQQHVDRRLRQQARNDIRSQDSEYTWQGFQRDERRDNSHRLFPPLNVSPPKPIKTIRLAESPSVPNPEIPGGVANNVCSSWLAKNQSLLRAKRVVAIKIEDSFSEETNGLEVIREEKDYDDQIVVLAEPMIRQVPRVSSGMESEGVAPPRRSPRKKKTLWNNGEEDPDNSIVVIGEFPSQKTSTGNTTMTQLDSTMAESIWSSKPTSSTSTPATSSSSTVPETSSTMPMTFSLFSSPPPPIIKSSSPINISIPPPRRTSSTSSIEIIDTTVPPPETRGRKIIDGFSKDCVAAKRAVRRWNKLRPVLNFIEKPPVTSSLFRVCSYNVLCQKTIERTGYLYRHLKNSPNFLDWEHRWKGLQEEIPKFNADILGLQEVQFDHFFAHFDPFMKKHGYKGIYKRKYGTSQKDDGCALFYRPSRFTLVAYKDVNYFISPESISNRENIGQILALRCLITDEILIVANTHLLFNGERGDVKLAQLSILFATIHKMRIDIARRADYTNSIPSLIVMGDFNMEPNSQIYRYVVNGLLHIDDEFIRTMSGQSARPDGKKCNAAELILQTTMATSIDVTYPFLAPEDDGSLRHPFQFTSAYHYSPEPTVVPYSQRCISTYHKDAASPDFIFFSKQFTRQNIEKLQLMERFELPTYNTLSTATPWPNEHVPSDHLPIMAKFELTKDYPNDY